jgi:hypothetical protein
VEKDFDNAANILLDKARRKEERRREEARRVLGSE